MSFLKEGREKWSSEEGEKEDDDDDGNKEERCHEKHVLLEQMDGWISLKKTNQPYHDHQASLHDDI